MSDEPVYGRGDVLWRRTYDRVVLLLPGSGEFVTLKGTGCDLWAALEAPGSLGELAERLAEAYGAPVAQIAADIAPVIDELGRCGAVAVTGRGR
ncbi:MAG: PqqD family protein [Nocardioidaceae bacterium]